MGMARTEVNLRRLIAKCELMAKSDRNNDRLDKYLESMDEMLIELEKVNPKPSLDSMTEYSNRIEKLKSILNKTSPKSFSYETKPLSFKEARQELLGGVDLNSTVLSTSTNESDVEKLLNYHTNMQDKVANEMLALTKSLKEQTILAGNIIRKDTETVKKSAVIAEGNVEKLKEESEKLTDHSKRACKCWMWLMILVVLAVFISMVLFMKVMKKRTL